MPKEWPEGLILPEVKPLLPAAIKQIPENLDPYVVDVKLNGVRAIVYLMPDGNIRIVGKEGQGYTSRFPEFHEGFRALQRRHVMILDGEIISGEGKTNAERNKVIARINTSRDIDLLFSQGNFTYMAFDMLYMDGTDLRPLSVVDRESYLNTYVRSSLTREFHIDHTAPAKERKAKGPFILKAAEERYEGIVLKRIHGTYSPRSPQNWLKFKFSQLERSQE